MALEATETIIDDEGFRGLSTRKIAARIGYTVGSLYLVFRNLDALILTVNARTLDALYQALQAAAAGSAGVERITLLGHAYLDFALRHRHRWQLIFSYSLPPEEPLPDWYRDKVARMFALVEEPLRALAPQRSAAEVTLAAHALWSGVHGACILSLDGKLDLSGRYTVEVVADALIKGYLDGFNLETNP